MTKLKIQEVGIYSDTEKYLGVVQTSLTDEGYELNLDQTCFSLDQLKDLVTKFEESIKLLDKVIE